jgi:hypothetical protein
LLLTTNGGAAASGERRDCIARNDGMTPLGAVAQLASR